MELLKEEQVYMDLVKDRHYSPKDMCEYVTGLYDSHYSRKFDLTSVNWLKIGIALNHETLVDAIFTSDTPLNIPTTNEKIEEAIQFGIDNKHIINPSIMDRIAKNIVNEEYEYKHYFQHPNLPPGYLIETPTYFSNIPTDRLNHIQYALEKVKDIFKKPEDIKNRIAQMREKMTNSPDINQFSKPKQ